MAKHIPQKHTVNQSLDGSALKLTVIISLAISILLGSLIYLYAFYKQQSDRIHAETTILQLMESATSFAQSTYLDNIDTVLRDFLQKDDSLRIQKSTWGLYDKIQIRAYNGRDSLYKAFLLGRESTDSTVLFVADEDRNLSISGKTEIVGTGFIPQAGIKPTFVDGDYYSGKEEMIQGKLKYSDRDLPGFDSERLKFYTNDMEYSPLDFQQLPRHLSVSHHIPTAYYRSANEITLSSYELTGNIIISSDTVIHIAASSTLQGIICIAPTIKVDDGFHGQVQLFATDSIHIGERLSLQYPSAIVLNPEAKPSKNKQITATDHRIHIGKESEIHGVVFLAEAKRSTIPHIMEFEKDCTVYGDVIAFGILKYHKPMKVMGSTYCYRFITQTPSSLYENYLIDLDLNRLKRSAHYLESYALNTQQKNRPANRILVWHH